MKHAALVLLFAIFTHFYKPTHCSHPQVDIVPLGDDGNHDELMLVEYKSKGGVHPEVKTPPNIILIITDDQDLTMGGMTPMSFTKQMMEETGSSFENVFVNVPVCCPSRSSLLTGRYQHNTRVVNNSVAGNCNGDYWRNSVEPHSAAAYLKSAGYTTFYAGKYLNQYGLPKAGGIGHVPAGYDWWVGLVGNSRYYNYILSVNGTAEMHGNVYEDDYLTDLIKRRGIEFLQTRSADSGPFFMTLATPAPHAPQTPAPQHADLFQDQRAPRTPDFNIRAQHHHRQLSMEPIPLPQGTLDTMDETFRDRWRTLVSVDEMVQAVVEQLEEQKLLEDTVIIYTSDHGYHIGQFALTVDKRQMYDFDLRVPLYMTGPGVPRKSSFSSPITFVDLAPTLLDLAGVATPTDMDGISLLETMARETSETTDTEDESRTGLLVSYHAEHGKGIQPDCTYRGLNVSFCMKEYSCKCQDSIDNTYVCIRKMGDDINHIACRFSVPEEFFEAYDLSMDPYQLNNLAVEWSDENRKYWRDRLAAAELCSGKSCQSI